MLSTGTLSVGLLVMVELLRHAGVDADLKVGGPHNVVGYFTGHVTLHCNRNAAGGVTWSYIAPGTEREQPVPGKHSYAGSNYGQHNLRLENLQRSDAGLYVCRSSHVPQAFDPTSAFVVVVANQPICRANYTKLVDEGKFTLSCLITYNGLLNLTLSLLRSEDNYVVDSRNYTSVVGGSWRRLEGEVSVNATGRRLKQHVCRANFYNTKTDSDIAKNRPTNLEVPCEPALTEIRGTSSARPRVQTSVPGLSSQTTIEGVLYNGLTHSSFLNTEVRGITANGEASSHQAVVSMSAIALTLVLALIVSAIVAVTVFFIRKRKMQKRERERRGGQPESSSLMSREHGDEANKVTSTLSGEAASKVPRNSSAGNVNCSAQDLSVQYHVDTTDPVQPSNSVSDVSLHSTD